MDPVQSFILNRLLRRYLRQRLSFSRAASLCLRPDLALSTRLRRRLLLPPLLLPLRMPQGSSAASRSSIAVLNRVAPAVAMDSVLRAALASSRELPVSSPADHVPSILPVLDLQALVRLRLAHGRALVLVPDLERVQVVVLVLPAVHRLLVKLHVRSVLPVRQEAAVDSNILRLKKAR